MKYNSACDSIARYVTGIYSRRFPGYRPTDLHFHLASRLTTITNLKR